MRPDKVETAVQCSVCRMLVLAGFSAHGNLINIYIYVCVCVCCIILYRFSDVNNNNTDMGGLCRFRYERFF